MIQLTEENTTLVKRFEMEVNMADIDYSDLEDLTLTMEEEDGTTTECDLQFVFEYEGQDYGAFCEKDSDSGGNAAEHA